MEVNQASNPAEMKTALRSNAKELSIDYQEDMEDRIAADMYDNLPWEGFWSRGDLQNWYSDVVSMQTMFDELLKNYNQDAARTEETIFKQSFETLDSVTKLDAYEMRLDGREVSANQILQNLQFIKNAIEKKVVGNEENQLSSINDFFDSYSVDSSITTVEKFLQHIYGQIYTQGSSMLTMKSGFNKNGQCGQSCGSVEEGDWVHLDFSKPMDAENMGSDFNVVIEPDGMVRVYRGDSQEEDKLVASILHPQNVNGNNGDDVTFASSAGEWADDNTSLTITMNGRDGTIDNNPMVLQWTNLTIEKGAVDANGNNVTPVTTIGLPSRW